MTESSTRREIRFLLGDELRYLESADPTITVLDWLRTVEGMTGTKEGCAEGDCGACTVLVGRLVNGELRYESVNCCIRFLATLDGCQLVTVEHLARPDGALHPVQQALVDCHGSQCGFCTPGIVMSLYAVWLNEARPDVDRIGIALQGNLCRCTGYASIMAAAERMYGLGNREPGRLTASRDDTRRRLAELADDATVEVAGKGRRFIAPASVDALSDVLAAEAGATMVAGATDVGLWVTKSMRTLDPVVYLGRLDELRWIKERDDGIVVGAGATYSDAWPVLAKHFPSLDELVRRLGGEQIRNMGTIGGNIANGSPIGDTPPPFIALGAELALRRGSERRTMPLEDFFLDYGKQDLRSGEFVEGVRIPKLKDGSRFRVYKITKRIDEDISSVLGAFRIDIGEDGGIKDARVAFGGMAAIPKRALGAEKALIGQPWTEGSLARAIEALGRDFSPITDCRASATYRARVAGNLLRRFFLETTDSGVETRVPG